MIKVLLVDDEIPAQKELIYIIDRHPGFVVSGAAGNGQEALRMAEELKPEVIFVDIQLYGMSGLELAEKLICQNRDALIVFATAYDDYAVKAFELDAFDYVVKPFDEHRIAKTLEKVRSVLAQKQNQPAPQMVPETLDRLCVSARDRWMVIDCREIVYITTEERKSLVKLDRDSFHVHQTLQEIHKKLGNRNFIRVHKAYIVNLAHIKELIPWFNGSFNLVMNDSQKSEVPVSRHYAKELKSRIGINTLHA